MYRTWVTATNADSHANADLHLCKHGMISMFLHASPNSSLQRQQLPDSQHLSQQNLTGVEMGKKRASGYIHLF